MKKSETKQHIVAPVEGMTCAACVARVEKSLSLTKGLSNVSVNFATEKASFNIDTSITNYEDVVKVIEASGYKINLSHEFQQEDEISVADSNNFKSKDERELKNNFFLAAILSLPILLLNMGSMWNEFYKLISLNSDEVNKVLLLLTTPVVFIAGKRFYKIAWQKLKHFSADMNTLVAIGTGSAYLFSSVITLFPIIYSEDSTAQHVYFDTAAVIITLILLGRWLESRAKSRTGSAIKKLLELKPKTAIIIRNGSEVEISLYNLRLGDIVIVKPGAQIPADGIVTSGYSSVDESMITGESVPVGKEIGSKIIGGTINFNGSFQFNVTALGNSSLLGQIIKMIEKAQGSKAPIQKLADKIASIFVPVILLIAVITFSGWMLFGTEGGINTALLNFVAVLIIACPCALGLATPMSVMVGVGRGAQSGVLIKNAEALEKMNKVNTL
ncbi:MAG: heavy metal translocating P-type ATPase, partial [Ignavibacteria bacterium]|nr:heavy metal translocating P-type ATPase [Ignavibacteria bacterium]